MPDILKFWKENSLNILYMYCKGLMHNFSYVNALGVQDALV